ncbi:hypothetical protein V8C35DRAFT_297328 [Trichoderma chlorosporum]
MRSFCQLETCDGVPTLRFWAFQAQTLVPNWCQIHHQHRQQHRPASHHLPGPPNPLKHSSSRAVVQQAISLSILAVGRSQGIARYNWTPQAAGIHQVGKLGWTWHCNRCESRAAGAFSSICVSCAKTKLCPSSRDRGAAMEYLSNGVVFPAYPGNCPKKKREFPKVKSTR